MNQALAEGDAERQVVLVVDDDEELRAAIVMLLRDDGYEVVEARDGLEALELLTGDEAFRPSFVLLDMMMPRLNGWDVVQELRSDDELRDIPVAIMTANPDLVPRDGIRLLAKPFHPRALTKLIGGGN